VIPNPWDVGSARLLQSMGFEALATTSGGHAFSRGVPDGQQSLDVVLGYLSEMAGATDLPLSADFENGFADDPEEVAENVTKCLATGVAGLSIEDAFSSRAKTESLYDFDLAVARVRAARTAIDRAGSAAVLTARSEGFIRGSPDLGETIHRLKAYSAAGADCLFAPGITTREEIEAVVNAVAPKPVNVLALGSGLTVSSLRALGVRRISVGGALQRVAFDAFIKAAQQIADEGTFDSFVGIKSYTDLNKFFSECPKPAKS